MASKKGSKENSKEKNGILQKWAIDDKPVKIDKWDGTAVKNALDDSVRKVFTERLPYTEVHSLMDGRLGICGFAVSVALYALLYDYLYPFPQSRLVLISCVTLYFISILFLALYTTYKERGVFLTVVSGNKDYSTWEVTSNLKRFDDQYHLSVRVIDSQTGVERESTIVKSIASWFDTEGYMHSDIFENEVVKLHSSLKKEKKDK